MKNLKYFFLIKMNFMKLKKILKLNLYFRKDEI